MYNIWIWLLYTLWIDHHDNLLTIHHHIKKYYWLYSLCCTLNTWDIWSKLWFFPVVFPVVMWELDHKEGWALKNWCFQTMVLVKTLESPLDWKEIKPVNPKENQPWVFIGRTDAETDIPVLWLPDVKSQLNGKDPDVGQDWRQ